MSMPEQVRKQIEEANKLIETHYGAVEGGEATAQQGGETPAATESAPVKSEAATPTETVQSETPPAQAAQQEDENSPTYKQRWLSLQGQWNSLRGQNDSLTQRVAQLEQLITTMQTAPAQPAPEQRQTQSEKYITPQDVENYGEDMVEFAQRVSRQENAALRTELERTQKVLMAMEQRLNGLQQVVPTVQQVAHRQHLSAEQEFFAAIGDMVPGWEATNSNPNFHEWLLTPDPLTGITRQTYLEDAQKSLDAARVAAIFSAFAPGKPATAQPNKASSELEHQIAPGRTLAASSPSTQEAKRWSRAEISKLYQDRQRGVFKGREAEFKELERDIFAAQKDGRIAA